MSNSIRIFVDADVFVAMVRKDDSNHLKAARLYYKLENINTSFITTNYVFSEAVTVISQKMGHQSALDFIINMKAPGGIFSIIWISPEIESLAIEIFRQQTSKNVSFVDCANMAVVRHDDIDAIFSFDEIYRKNGFKVLRARP